MLKVHEIFATIQGEGYDTGLPTTFVRLWGCNVHCSFCDQPQTKQNLRRMAVGRVADEVRKIRLPNVCITGGEPLMQDEVYSLIYELVSLGYNVSIETNGTIDIPEVKRRSFKYVMDVKCPSSGVQDKNKFSNLEKLLPKDEVKFVIANREDYDYMKEVMRKYPTVAKILISPVFDVKSGKQTIGQELCKWVIEDKLNAKVQIQMHKVLGVL